jgi:hypothetical protein
VSEAQNAIDINPTLAAGISEISEPQSIAFTQYVRYVLPLDGYVFWLATQQRQVYGSFHYAIQDQQNQEESLAINRVLFTTQEEVQAFQEIAPNTIWVGCWGRLKFAFSSRGPYSANAGVYHYSGDAVYPFMESQLLDVGAQPSPDTVIVSNSLPAWLQIVSYEPVWLDPANPRIVLYPSFLVPDNLRPPYGVVHIDPSGTTALQGVPLLGPTATHTQLAQDKVRVTLYGLTNDAAMDWLDTALRYMQDTNVIGLMNTPIVRDEKRGQVELGILAEKKTIDFEVAYDQSSVRAVARQLVIDATSAMVQTLPLAA